MVLKRNHSQVDAPTRPPLPTRRLMFPLARNFGPVFGQPRMGDEEENLRAALAASLEDARREEEKRQREMLEEAMRCKRLEEEIAAAAALAVAEEEKRQAESAMPQETDPDEDDMMEEEQDAQPPALLHMTWDRTWPAIGGGLKNLGNSCFMNASLQALAYVAPLTQAIARSDHRSRCTATGFCALCECTSFFPRMVRSDGVVAATNLFKNLPKLNDFLSPGRQEDAHEFVSSLLNRVGEEEGENGGLMQSLFFGRTRTTTRCGCCSATSFREEAFNCLSVDVSGSLNESLMLLSTPEIMRGDDAYFCDACDSKKVASKSLRVCELPPVLLIHLKRFEVKMSKDDFCAWPVMTKVDDFESFPLEFEFGSHFLECDSGREYELQSVLVHAGATLGCGHYYCHVRGCDGKWYRMNDDRVSAVSEEKVLREQAYILCYVRKGIVQGGNVRAVLNEDVSCSSSVSSDDASDVVVDDFYGVGDGVDLDYESFEHVPWLQWNEVMEDWLREDDGEEEGSHWVEGEWVGEY